MNSERIHALVVAASFSVPAILISALMIPLASRAADGRLMRNQWVGIRTPSTMRSDGAWMAGHRAALRLTPVFVLTTVASCVALGAAALCGSTRGVVVVVGLASFGAVLVVALWSAVIASRAARSAEEPADGEQRQ